MTSIAEHLRERPHHEHLRRAELPLRVGSTVAIGGRPPGRGQRLSIELPVRRTLLLLENATPRRDAGGEQDGEPAAEKPERGEER